MKRCWKKFMKVLATLILLHSGAGLGQPDQPSKGIKVDEEIFDLLNLSEIQRAPAEIDVFKDCASEDAGLFFFITPIMTYLEAESREQSVTRFFSAEQLDRAIRLKLKKTGTPLEMFCGHIVAETEKVKQGHYTYGDILDHILACKKVCGPTMSAMASVYIFNSSKYFQGLIRFNYDSDTLFSNLQGDFSQGYMTIDNRQALEEVYREWLETGRSYKIGLDARASQPGGQLYNDELSRARLVQVENWFTDVKGVPPSMIDRKWFGNYGPFIDQPVAALYRLNDIYDQYNNNVEAAKSFIDGRYVFFGINQSVAMFLYRDVDIHIEVEPVN